MKRARRGRSEAGMTLVEVMIYLTIGLIVIGSIYQLVISQSRSYATQRELMDVRGSVRAAGVLLSWELRQASAANGDLYAIGPNAFTVRSIQATGVMCGEHLTLLRYGLWGTSGTFSQTADDSALMFAANGLAMTDDAWRLVKIAKLWDPNGGGVPKCFWGDTAAGKGKGKNTGTSKLSNGTVLTELVLEVSGDVTGVYVGAPVLAFRRTEYGIYQDAGRWWLGRRVGAAAAWEKLTGPLRAPTDGGLQFVYYDAAGAVTANRLQVAEVEIVIRGESFGKVRPAGGSRTPTVKRDTVRTRVALQG